MRWSFWHHKSPSTHIIIGKASTVCGRLFQPWFSQSGRCIPVKSVGWGWKSLSRRMNQQLVYRCVAAARLIPVEPRSGISRAAATLDWITLCNIFTIAVGQSTYYTHRSHIAMFKSCLLYHRTLIISEAVFLHWHHIPPRRPAVHHFILSAVLNARLTSKQARHEKAPKSRRAYISSSHSICNANMLFLVTVWVRATNGATVILQTPCLFHW